MIMQTIQITPRFFIGLFLLIVALAACKKDGPQQPAPQPVPLPIAKDLSVSFTNSSIPFTDVDSVVVVVRDQQNFVKEWKTMQKGPASFTINLLQLAAGTYAAELYVYTKKRPDFTARQYALTKTIVLPLQQPLVLKAPTGSFSDSWFQRAIFSEGQEDALIIVAMDPRDSYYEMRLRSTTGKRIYMERYSVDGNAVVASKTTSRDVTGLVGLGEYADYLSYVEAMNGKAWTKAVVSGWIDQEGVGDVGFHYEYFNH
jgi:hypothetical protein